MPGVGSLRLGQFFTRSASSSCLAWPGLARHAELQDDLQALRDTQQPDGGWSQLPHLHSDAWATGQSLVALRVAGRVPANDPVFQRGIDYLLRMQFDDGSWYVQGRAWPFQPPFDSGFPFGRDQWISAGATAWAVMALLLEVEPTTPSVVPSKTDDRLHSDAVAAVSSTPTAPKSAPAPAVAQRRSQPLEFARDIKPVLERSCVACHSGEKPEGGFLVTDRAALLRGGESGEPAVLSGRSGQSPLFARISGQDPDLAMPPKAKRDKFPALSKEELQAFRAWIDEGTVWPANVSVKPAPY